MANVSVRIRIDKPRMRAVVGDISEQALMRAGRITRDRYRSNILQANLKNTGEMARTVTMRAIPGQERMHPLLRVGTPVPYAKFHEYGTRAHGPVKAKMLRFKPKGSGTYVFAKWVRGVKPTKFAQNALDAIRPTDFE